MGCEAWNDLESDRSFKGSYRVPVGMGLVVPIERVIELIEENETLKKWREGMKKGSPQSPINS